MASTELESVRGIQGFHLIVKAVIRSQIKHLVNYFDFEQL